VSGEKKRFETSKVVLCCVLCACFLMALAILTGWFMGREDAAGLLAAVFTPGAISIGFYSWKAKAENVLKYAQKIDEIKEGEKDVQREVLNTVARENVSGSNSYYNGY